MAFSKDTPVWLHAVPILLFLAERVGCAWAGIGMDIPWGYYQLLDRQELAANPFWSLFFLHSQPPLLNGLLAVILKSSSVTGASPEVWANACFVGLGAWIAWGVFRLAWLLTGRIGWATLATVLVLADPGTHVFQHQYFYPLILQALLVGVALCTYHYLTGGRARYGLAIVMLAVAACNTSSLYHPVWALGLTGLLVWFRKERDRRDWVVTVAMAVLLVGITAWPLKNLVVFGQFTSSTWEGMNLARGVEGLAKEASRPEWGRKTEEGLAALRARYPGAPVRVLESRTKSDGSINMNQYRWVVLNPPLKTLASRWRNQHPGEWFRIARAQYWMWTRASYADCYLDALAVPGNAAYRLYARIHEAVFYPDLRPALGQVCPAVWEGVVSHITHRPVPVTGFGAVTFPALMIGVLAFNGSGRGRGRLPSAGTCMVMVYAVVWVLVVTCLTDGHEGNRMRFAVDPLIAILAVKMGHDLMTRRAARRRACPVGGQRAR